MTGILSLVHNMAIKVQKPALAKCIPLLLILVNDEFETSPKVRTSWDQLSHWPPAIWLWKTIKINETEPLTKRDQGKGSVPSWFAVRGRTGYPRLASISFPVQKRPCFLDLKSKCNEDHKPWCQSWSKTERKQLTTHWLSVRLDMLDEEVLRIGPDLGVCSERHECSRSQLGSLSKVRVCGQVQKHFVRGSFHILTQVLLSTGTLVAGVCHLNFLLVCCQKDFWGQFWLFIAVQEKHARKLIKTPSAIPAHPFFMVQDSPKAPSACGLSKVSRAKPARIKTISRV